jgi:phosphatidylglycerophosphate synthase
METQNRRPIKTRSAAWAGAAARGLARSGFTPNRVSVIGVVIALAGAGALAFSRNYSGPAAAVLLVAGAITIQLRLLCNMLDGLIAVENGLKSKLGDVFNEVPDRIEDVALLLGAGIAAGGAYGVTLGWLTALLAMGTAYVRLLGGSLGMKQDFCGPLAKPQRMFFLTVAALGAALETTITQTTWALSGGLVFIALGTTWTLIRRLLRLAHSLQTR